MSAGQPHGTVAVPVARALVDQPATLCDHEHSARRPGSERRDDQGIGGGDAAGEAEVVPDERGTAGLTADRFALELTRIVPWTSRRNTRPAAYRPAPGRAITFAGTASELPVRAAARSHTRVSGA